jgi:hypothetical protein
MIADWGSIEKLKGAGYSSTDAGTRNSRFDPDSLLTFGRLDSLRRSNHYGAHKCAIYPNSGANSPTGTLNLGLTDNQRPPRFMVTDSVAKSQAQASEESWLWYSCCPCLSVAV